MVELISLKNHLNKNNIFLLDIQYRIVHYRLNNINLLSEQLGGGINKKKNIFYFQDNLLKHLINAVLNKNINKISWIFNNY
jgi:hypothetical protein